MDNTPRTCVKEFTQPAVFLQRCDQRGRANAEEERRLEGRTQAHYLEHVRVLVELLAYRPLVVVSEIRLFAALLRHLPSKTRYRKTK